MRIGIGLAVVAALALPHSASASALSVTDLRVNAMSAPLGLDDATPTLSWRLTSHRRGQLQRAYQVRAGAAPGRADLWDSGKVASRDSIDVPYRGRPLRSRERVHWTVRAWDDDGKPSSWSRPAHWEMGLLARDDWQARWIANRDWLDEVEPLVIRFPSRRARYVRLDATRLGKPIKEGWPDPVSRLQIAEMQAFAGGQLVSGSATAQASEAYTAPGQWEVKAITDGKLTSKGAPHGYTSLERFSQDLGGSSIWVELDLGSEADLDEVRLYPRTDVLTADRAIPNFPEDFSIQTRTDGAPDVAFSVRGQAPPEAPRQPEALPLFARGFELSKPVARARLYAVGLGVYEARLNGEKVGDAVLEPANTDYRDRVRYTTYDVTRLLRRGPNVLGMMLGNGIYNVPSTPGRYQKLAETMGPPKLLAQLEVTYADGSRTTIASDDAWRTTDGPLTFSGWYGGEDHDARREPAGWDRPGADHGAWDAAAVSDAPAAGTELSAQEAPPIRAQETLTAVSRQEVAPGVWLYDLGRNIAGWPEITVRGAKDATVKVVTGEQLRDGRVTQAEIGGPVYFSYTAASDEEVTWHPRFAYHGFRYVEVSGVDEPPDVRGLVLRADNAREGSLETSDPMLNRIHELVVRAIEGNMYSVLTDCPHREKLGWLEETHLVFDGVAANFDVAAYYRQLIRNVIDSQLPNGMVSSISPEYTVFSGGFRDDPNWGGALILAPWKLYEAYGDVDTLRDAYPAMRRYMDYLATRASGHILDYGLGDWGAFDTSTPVAVAVTTAYYRFASAMSEIAAVVGDDAGASGYRTLAGEIAAAFNARYFDPETRSYGSSQASNALPLAAGMVPAEHREAVLAHVLDDVAARGDHLSPGEIGLRALLDALGDGGHADEVLKMATNPTSPSYAHMVLNGATTLWEFWDGGGSRNHFMMGAIDDWMYRHLAGIKPDAPGFRRFTVAPQPAGGLDHVRAAWPSPYGRIVSAWRRTGSVLHLEVEVPVNTTARVAVPGDRVTAMPGARFVGRENGRTVYEVGSGDWRFLAR